MVNHIYLAHHGIKGQKWGVRRFQYEDGSLTSAGKKRYDGNTSNVKRLLTSKHGFGTIARAQEKRDMLQNKIAKSGDRNVVSRSINDWRAGRIKQIDRKIENRSAKKAYLKNRTAENKERLGRARVDRLVKNGVLGQIPNNVIAQGKYDRHRQNGNTIATAALKTIGGVALTSLAVGTAYAAASSAATAAATKGMTNAMQRALQDEELQRAAARAMMGL